jgi:hypothetical protein
MVVVAMAVAAGVGGAVAGCHPTGTPIVDPIYTGLFAALVSLASSRAGRAWLLVLAAVGVALSRGWLLVPSAVALSLAFGSVWMRRQRRRWGALIGGLAIQVVLRWPAIGFNGLTALIASITVGLCLISSYSHLKGTSRRWARRAALGVVTVFMVFALPAIVGVLLARSSADHGIAETDSAITSVLGASTDSGGQRLTHAATDFSATSERAGSWWSSEAQLVPVVAQQRRAIVAAASSGQAVTSAAAQVAAHTGMGHLAFSDGRFNLAAIRQLAAPIRRIVRTMTVAQSRLEAVRSPWLVAPIGDRLTSLDARLTRVQVTAGLVSQLVQVIPGILGGDGVRHYFIAFMTPSESRGLDGFIGAYGEVRADDGRLSLVRAGSVKSLNRAPVGTRHISGPADYLARYGQFDPADFFQDLSYSPDFPTVERVIAQMYPQSGGNHIDGVLALDPYALAALLGLTGPVTVPGLAAPLTSANAADFLLEGEYDLFGKANAARHDFLQEALTAVFDRLVADRLPSPEAVDRDLAPVVKAGRLLFWTDRPAEQGVLSRLSLAGAFPQAEGSDLLAVTTQNAANNKIDSYLDRTIHDVVQFDPATGETTATVTVTLHNAAPVAGLPEIVGGSYTGSGLRADTNRTWMSVYSPLRLVRATDDGAATSVGSVRELGVNTYSTYVDIGPGGSQTIGFVLHGRLRPGATYVLNLRNQPMIRPDDVSIRITPTPGWHEEIQESLGPSGNENQQEVARFALSRAQHVVVGLH